ncbi:TPA: hypothetical protein OU174_001072 [Escherichia coli]|nr:hypothetical protein [Escherichia coli]
MTSKENTPLKVTPEHIEQLIQSEHYFTAYDASYGDNFISVYNSKTDIDKCHESLKLLTFCVMVLKNGYTVTGKSACVRPEIFNFDVGREYARKDAIDQIWPLEGYLLKQKWHEAKQ